MTTPTAATSYRGMGRIYEPLARLYSGGAIPRCKVSQLERFAPGDRVLYAGGGAGEDAVAAARRGARVTLVDRSPSMLREARRKLAGGDLDLELIQSDVMDHDRPRSYDAITANFFLNVFPRAIVPRVLSQLGRLLRPGGCLLIADFAPSSPRAWARLFQHGYYLLPLASFCLWTGNAWRPLVDYTREIPDGMHEEAREYFRLGGFGPEWFCCWTWRKEGGER